jgi:cysteine desulfurase/selenocysteine lyase
LFDVTTIRRQFPLLAAQPELAYLDSAATAHKPQAVIDADFSATMWKEGFGAL